MEQPSCKMSLGSPCCAMSCRRDRPAAWRCGERCGGAPGKMQELKCFRSQVEWCALQRGRESAHQSRRRRGISAGQRATQERSCGIANDPRTPAVRLRRHFRSASIPQPAAVRLGTKSNATAIMRKRMGGPPRPRGAGVNSSAVSSLEDTYCVLQELALESGKLSTSARCRP